MDHIAYTTGFWPFEKKHTDNLLAGLGDWWWYNHMHNDTKYDKSHQAAVRSAEEFGMNVLGIKGVLGPAVQNVGDWVKSNPFLKEKVVKEVIEKQYNKTSNTEKAAAMKQGGKDVLVRHKNNAKKGVAKAADSISEASKKTIEAARRFTAKATKAKKNLPSAQSKRAPGRGSG